MPDPFVKSLAERVAGLRVNDLGLVTHEFIETKDQFLKPEGDEVLRQMQRLLRQPR